jgi:hypothetical protein
MPSLYPAPSEQNIEAFLGGLLSNGTHVVRVPSPEPVREPTGLIAEYVTDADSLAVVAFADHDVVNFVGGAIAAVEAGTIQEISKRTALDDAAMESFRAVVDGLGSSFNGEYTPAVRLSDVHQLPGELSEDIKQLWRRPRGRRAYRVTVDDYGSGMVLLYLN